MDPVLGGFADPALTEWAFFSSSEHGITGYLPRGLHVNGYTLDHLFRWWPKAHKKVVGYNRYVRSPFLTLTVADLMALIVNYWHEEDQRQANGGPAPALYLSPRLSPAQVLNRLLKLSEEELLAKRVMLALRQ
jgi:hypothetical protein